MKIDKTNKEKSDYENNEEHFVNLFPNIDKEHVLKVAKITNLLSFDF